MFLTTLIRQYYAHTGREVKRLESQTKSPIFNYISETLNGRAVLKASKLENDLVERFMEVEDEHSSVFRILVLTRRWLAFRIEMVVAVTISGKL